MENVGGKSTSVENKLTSKQCIKKMLFHLIGPPNFVYRLVYQGVDFSSD
jgi:hypothetical protein